MIEHRLVEPTCSEWASNGVMVRKVIETLRFRVDYRQFNERTRKDSYPLPRIDIDVCLDALVGAAWFSTFDLRSGHNQVEMNPRDSDKTTFVNRRETFKFKVMSFAYVTPGHLPANNERGDGLAESYGVLSILGRHYRPLQGPVGPLEPAANVI